MRLQLLSDLHMESEDFTPQPAPGADALVLAGDIDTTWAAYRRFADWPVPVYVIAGDHEFDGRELTQAWPAFRAYCAGLGLRVIEREAIALPWPSASGRAVRLLGTVRWSDFDLFGSANREKALRAASYFQRGMRATLHGSPFDAEAVRAEGLACREWLAQALAEPFDGQTVVVTHFAPSLLSLDKRFGKQPGTASFCNADDALMPGVDVWLHGHVHCRHDYTVAHAGGSSTRVVSQARGLVRKGEAEGYNPLLMVEI